MTREIEDKVDELHALLVSMTFRSTRQRILNAEHRCDEIRALLKSGNDATKNEAASAEEVGPPNDLPFLPYKYEDEAFHAYLTKTHGLTTKEIEQHQEEDNEYLTTGETYSGMEEIFCAGWDACRETIERLHAQKRGEAASPAQNPAKATTEEDPVTDETELETTTNERTPAVRKVE